MTIGEAVRKAAQNFGDIEAIVYSKQPDCCDLRITFAELDQLTNRIASGMLQAELKPGARIGVWMPNEPEWIILQWSIAKAGMAIVTLNPLYRERELDHTLRLAEVDAIFCLDELRDFRPLEMVLKIQPQLSKLRHVFSVHTDLPNLISAGDENASLPAPRDSELCMIQFTSGTTGAPRAAQLSHDNLIQTATTFFNTWGTRPGDRIVHGFPLFHIGGSGCLSVGSVVTGSTTLPMRIFDPETMLNTLSEERCTACFAVPTMYHKMLDVLEQHPRDTSTLRWLTSGGSLTHDELRHRIEKAFGAPMLNVYGQTECSGLISTGRLTDSEEVRGSRVGRAVAGVTLEVRDREGHVVPYETPGELWYTGPGAMMGHVGQEPPPVDAKGRRWIATGDRVIMYPDQTISILGRVKELIIRGGENLSPGEIEATIAEHPGVQEVAVIGVPDKVYGEEACAMVRKKPGADLTGEEIRAFCDKVLSRWKVPKYVLFVEEFPMTHSGKVQKFKLKETAVALLAEKMQIAI